MATQDLSRLDKLVIPDVATATAESEPSVGKRLESINLPEEASPTPEPVQTVPMPGTQAEDEIKFTLAFLRKLSPEMKSRTLRSYIDYNEAKLSGVYYAARETSHLLRNAATNIRGMLTGLGTVAGMGAIGIYNTITEDVLPYTYGSTPEKVKHGKLVAAVGESQAKEVEKFRAELRKLREMSVEVPYDFYGTKGTMKLPTTIGESEKREQYGKFLKSATKEVFKPYIESAKALDRGDYKEAIKIMGDYVHDEPISALLDASFGFGIAGKTVGAMGKAFKGLAETGSALNSVSKLARAGEVLEKTGQIIDPFLQSGRGLKYVAGLVKDTHIGRVIESRRFIGELQRESYRQFAKGLKEDVGQFQSIFGKLKPKEKEAFAATLEGLANPTDPNGALVEAMKKYTEYMDLTFQRLSGKELVDAQEFIKRKWQPLMDATGLTMAELNSLVENINIRTPAEVNSALNIAKEQAESTVLISSETVAEEAAKKSEELAPIAAVLSHADAEEILNLGKKRSQLGVQAELAKGKAVGKLHEEMGKVDEAIADNIKRVTGKDIRYNTIQIPEGKDLYETAKAGDIFVTEDGVEYLVRERGQGKGTYNKIMTSPQYLAGKERVGGKIVKAPGQEGDRIVLEPGKEVKGTLMRKKPKGTPPSGLPLSANEEEFLRDYFTQAKVKTAISTSGDELDQFLQGAENRLVSPEIQTAAEIAGTESIVRLARTNPVAARRLLDIHDAIKTREDFLYRVTNRVGHSVPPIAEKGVMISELKKLKIKFKELVEQAKSETTIGPSSPSDITRRLPVETEYQTLTMEEQAARAGAYGDEVAEALAAEGEISLGKQGIHRKPKKVIMEEDLLSRDIDPNTAESIYRIATGQVSLLKPSKGKGITSEIYRGTYSQLGATGLQASIENMAEKTAKYRYELPYRDMSKDIKASSPKWEDLDADTQGMMVNATAEELENIIKDIRAPIERGEKIRINPETSRQLSNTVYRMHTLAKELDRTATFEGVVQPIYDRVAEWTDQLLNDPLINPFYGHKVTTRSGRRVTIKHAKQWMKGDRLASDYQRYLTRSNPETMSTTAREKAIERTTQKLNELRIEAKTVRELAEMDPKAFQSTLGAMGVETTEDAIIAANFERDINDFMNVHAWAIGALDQMETRPGRHLTVHMREQLLADSMGRAITRGDLERQYAIESLKLQLEGTYQKINTVSGGKKPAGEPAKGILELIKDREGVASAARIPRSVIDPTTGIIDRSKFNRHIKELQNEAKLLQDPKLAQLARSEQIRREVRAAQSIEDPVHRAKKVAQIQAKGGTLGARTAGNVLGEITDLRRRAVAYNKAIRDLEGYHKDVTRIQRRIKELEAGVELEPSDVRTNWAEPDTAPPPNVTSKANPEPSRGAPGGVERRQVGKKEIRGAIDEIKMHLDKDETYRPSDDVMDIPEVKAYYEKVRKLRSQVGMSEFAAQEVKAIRGKEIEVPRILKPTMGRDTASANAIITQLNIAIKNDPPMREALQKIAASRSYLVGPGETFNIESIKMLLIDNGVPKPLRKQIQDLLQAYNYVRKSSPEISDLTPFVVQQLFGKDALTAADLIRIAAGKSLEGKLSRPGYYPHIWEKRHIILDARSPEGGALLADMRNKLGSTRDVETGLIKEMYKQGYTGFYDETGKYHKVVYGQPTRQWIAGLTNGKIQPSIKKPEFLRTHTNAWGYMVNDPELVSARFAKEVRRYEANMDMVKKIRDSGRAKPWNGDPDTILEGYVPFNYEGLMQFHTQNIDFLNTFKKTIQKAGYVADETFLKAIQEHIPKMQSSVSMAYKNELHQIPKELADAIYAHVSAGIVPNWIRWFDRGTDWWRALTLAVSPRWILNNLVSNTLLNTMAGVAPWDYIRAKMKMFEDIYPDELSTTGLYGAASEEFLLGRTGKTSRTFAVFDAMYGINRKVEDFYLQAGYFKSAERQARKYIMKDAGFRFYRSQKYLDELAEALGKMKQAGTPEMVQLQKNALEGAWEFLGNYQRLDPIERRWVRRIVPFWNWYKHINTLTYSLPFKHRNRAFVVGTLGRIGQDAVEDQFAELGIEYKDMEQFMQGRIVLPDSWRKHLQDNSDVAMVSTKSFNPFADVFNLPASMMQFVEQGGNRLPGLHPLLTVGIEKATGVNMFTGKPFTDPNVSDTSVGTQVYIGDDGQVIRRPGVAPPLWEHIARQTQLYDIAKDVANFIRFNQIAAQYGTNDIIHPKFIIDPKTGNPKYPQTAIVAFLKVMAANINFVADLNAWQDKIDMELEQGESGKFNRDIASKPEFREFAMKDIERPFTPSEETTFMRKMLRKKTRLPDKIKGLE